MPRVILTEGAVQGLRRCRAFLADKSPQAASRAAQAIERRFGQLAAMPAIGRPLEDASELRELLIGFGESGYVALYRHEELEDAVYVLAFRHQKEAGY